MKSQEYMKMLGLSAVDKVSGFEGEVTVVSLGAPGWVWVMLQPEVGTDGKREDGRWFDVKRLTITGMDAADIEVMEEDRRFVAALRLIPGIVRRKRRMADA